MNLLQLKYFQVVAKYESFIKASRELFVSQPALSQTIKKLEEDLGVSLFDRVGKKVILNAYGKTYLEYVNKAFDILDEGKNYLKNISRKGDDDILFATSIKVEFTRDVIVKYWNGHPDAKIHYDICSPDIAINKLLNGEVDFVLTNRKIDSLELEYQEQSKQRLYAFLGNGHPLSNRREVSFYELKDTTFLFTEQTQSSELIYELEKTFGFKPNTAFATNDPRTIMSLMNQKPYCYLVRSNIIHDASLDENRPNASFHFIREEIYSTDYIVTRRKNDFSLNKKKFLEYFCQTMAEYDQVTHLAAESFINQWNS